MWRIYRLPGSRNVWHIDQGESTTIVNVLGYQAEKSYSVDIGDGWPRAWIEIPEEYELHVVNGIGIFRISKPVDVFEGVKNE